MNQNANNSNQNPDLNNQEPNNSNPLPNNNSSIKSKLAKNWRFVPLVLIVAAFGGATTYILVNRKSSLNQTISYNKELTSKIEQQFLKWEKEQKDNPQTQEAYNFFEKNDLLQYKYKALVVKFYTSANKVTESEEKELEATVEQIKQSFSAYLSERQKITSEIENEIQKIDNLNQKFAKATSNLNDQDYFKKVSQTALIEKDKLKSLSNAELTLEIAKVNNLLALEKIIDANVTLTKGSQDQVQKVITKKAQRFFAKVNDSIQMLNLEKSSMPGLEIFIQRLEDIKQQYEQSTNSANTVEQFLNVVQYTKEASKTIELALTLVQNKDQLNNYFDNLKNKLKTTFTQDQEQGYDLHSFKEEVDNYLSIDPTKIDSLNVLVIKTQELQRLIDKINDSAQIANRIV
ncbi:hypothetical protein V2E24_01260 [Mycoplasmopsis ciconiae]|uniref:Uncharacterized protein n=1 Tax=Mycoplasmopsis ciconiae TaxID=561067 RepID=A0ABU7ML08_9BACT|nr:hypothetical protein [Mycoplasmopsis ciconiae]